MKPKTKDQINEIARLIWNETMDVHGKAGKSIDFSNDEYKWYGPFWNMALIAYVECFPKHRDLLRYKL